MISNQGEIEEGIQKGINYILSRIKNGLCVEYPKRGQGGGGTIWPTACVGSALSNFGIIRDDMLQSILSQQNQSGGWGWNNVVTPDADSTLRVLEFLQKVDFQDKNIIKKGEEFVMMHQRKDGGFSTYLPKAWSSEEYPNQDGWSSSHPDVTAIAIDVLSKNKLSNKEALSKAQQYLDRYIFENGPVSYWWRTPMYIIHAANCVQIIPVVDDTISTSLALLQEAKHGIFDEKRINFLLSLQNINGSFQPSKQLKIPRPHEILGDINQETVSIEPDENSILSTSAAIVSLHKQALLPDNR
ncbi:terpene cyclase/mutase family protein [Candidatus Parcubacteria bacterium]|nr:terpene cyclase/mutase family protein [Candidatus Parcubacteria bacterium]